MDRRRPRSAPSSAALGLVALLVVGCSANTSVASGASGSTVASTAVATVTTSPPASVAAPASTAPAAVASATTVAVDLGDLDKASYCTLATAITSATGAFAPDASADSVKTAFASMKSSLAELAARGATAQRQQFSDAVAVLGKADAILAANGFDVAKTQGELGTIDPDGSLIGAVTVVLTQRQSVCGS